MHRPPAFSTDDILGYRLDFEIARDGFVGVGMLRDDAALHNADMWLRCESYRVMKLNARARKEDKQMQIAFATGLRFTRYFGKSLDALND
ncbi:hypothetical protein [Curtobacterium herbarum]|uniref:Uncharacterized protein n=1 Tax=Curtobacterium herbarum TaxID=150122 RepID=A0ABP4K301_9MICO|nr:hypothetical protein [Curtobacterium herbarum]MBM7477037.1 hypothetical protein [Curtobacterium herbarum]MCS6544955.1 hypothetical protein [Curtobacterium herbarum]